MNLSSDTISFNHEGDLTDLQDCINGVTKKIHSLRREVRDHMSAHHVHLQSVLSNNSNLQMVAKTLLENVKDLQVRIDTQVKRDVTTFIDELRNMKDLLNESNMLVERVNKLLVIDTELKFVQSGRWNNDYLEIMKHLDIVQKYLREECQDIEYLDIFKTISETVCLLYSDTYKEVCKTWEDSLSITGLEVVDGNKTALLKVSIPRDVMQGLLMTLSLLEEVARRISIFSNSLFKEILVPIIENHATVTVNEQDSFQVLVVTSKEENSKDGVPDFTQILRNLTAAFNFIQENLNYKLEDGFIFLKEVGAYIGDKLTTHLDEQCITHTIPRKRQELEGFSNVIQEILAFDKLLKDIEFLDSSNKTLLRYGGSIEEIYLNKIIENYLDNARTIMKRDIQDIKEIMPKEIKDDEPPGSPVTSYVLDQVSLGLFQFPKCSISKSAEELILLIKEILTELVSDRQMNIESALKMFSTARDMFMMYRLAPFYHKRNIESIPQQAALLHNNLMFLAHEAMTLHLEFKSQYPPRLSQSLANFVDLVNPLRISATEVLNQQVIKQQDILVDMVKKTGFSSLSDCEKLTDTARKYLKQCLYQLSFLKNIWFHILPANVYCNIMGQLCRVFTEEIMCKVLATKDMTAETTSELAAVFGSIQEDLPSLFPEPKEIHRFVKNWIKFSELVYILRGTLREIEERWADGKGPLANEFTPVQLKHLIKAIFQTSDRRAAILASIN